MVEVDIRALKQNASAVVAKAATGETIHITDRGRPVAQLSAIPSSPLARLLASGRARTPRRPLHELPNHEWGIPGKRIEIDVGMQQREVLADRVRGDEAVPQLSDGLTTASARAVQRSGVLVVGWKRRKHRSACQQATKALQVPFVACAREHLHPNRMTGGDLVRK